MRLGCSIGDESLHSQVCDADRPLAYGVEEGRSGAKGEDVQDILSEIKGNLPDPAGAVNFVCSDPRCKGGLPCHATALDSLFGLVRPRRRQPKNPTRGGDGLGEDEEACVSRFQREREERSRLLAAVRRCNECTLAEFVPVVVGSEQVGWLNRATTS